VTGARLRLRIVLPCGLMIGPGKADLLQAIRDTGSIAAAGRSMGMSYKRAWMLVETLNAGFRSPLVEASRGGKGHGGATLTETGAQVLAAYRRMQTRAEAAAAPEIAELAALLRPEPVPK
jgi:molybdate transport system regulatory protein